MPAADCAIIILAAGSSSRLGKAKQLLHYKGRTLLQHAADAAIKSGIGEVMVVTGANGSHVASSLQNIKVHFSQNELWAEGMASSIRTGLSAILSMQPDLFSVVIMLCDQPFVSADLLQTLSATYQSAGKGIVACAYNGTAGVPALFGCKYFDALLSLTGAEGAKKIITRHPDDTITIPFPAGAIDIDTQEDYGRLIK